MIGTWYRDSYFNWMCYSLYILNPIGHCVYRSISMIIYGMYQIRLVSICARFLKRQIYVYGCTSREKQTECSFIRRSYLFLSTVAEKSFYTNTFAKIVSSHISSLTSFFSCNAIIMINLIRKLKAKLFTIYVLLYNCSPLKDPYLCFFA